MNSKLNIFNNYEPSEIYLCNPDKKELCSVIGTNGKVVLRLNDLSEFSIEVDKKITNQKGEIIKNPCYDLLETRRLLYITSIGWFEIDGVVENDNAEGCIKAVTAKSHQISLQNKGFLSEERTYTFYNSADPLDDEYDASKVESIPSVIGQLHKQLGIGVDLQYEDVEPTQDYPIWTIVYIDQELRFPEGKDGVYRTLTESLTNGYDFMVNLASDKYEVIWIFDILHHTIKAKTVKSITTPTDIYLSLNNLIQSIEVSENASDIVTVLNCSGGDLDIRTVNPMGTNYVVDFSYYKNPDGTWMSDELISALDTWKTIYDEKSVLYKELVMQLRDIYGQQTSISGLITRSQLKIDDLTKARDLYIAEYPLLVEIFYQDSKSKDPVSIFNTEYFTRDTIIVGYRRTPTLENGKFVFSGTDNEATAETNYENGYIYFQDGDLTTYCKLIVDEEVLKIERYGQYDLARDWCSCSEDMGVIVAAESVELNGFSLDESSEFYINPFIKNSLTIFKCYKEAPSLDDSGDFIGGNDFIEDTLDECFNSQYLYFIDGDGKSYCKLSGAADVDVESGDATYYASGFTRFIMIHNITLWIDKHEDYCFELKTSYDAWENEASEIAESMKTISNECNLLSYIKRCDETGKLYRELECYWIEGDYTNDSLTITDKTTLEEEIDLAEELMKCGEQQLVRKAQPTFSFSISALDFTKMKEFKKFASQLQLGRTITVEKSDNLLYTPAVTEMSFYIDDANDFTLVFSNSARLNSNDFTFADLVAENSRVSKSVSSNWQELTNYAKNKDLISNLIANPLDRALRAGNSNMINQEFIVDSTGILGRRYLDDSHSSFANEQMRIMNNTILFTDDNWETVKTALGRIYYDYNGQERSAYGIVAETIIGSLLIGEHLKISNENSSVDIGIDGITIIKEEDNTVVFHADTNGNVSVIGDITATSGYIGDKESGFEITSNAILNNIDDKNTRFLLSTTQGEPIEYTVGNYVRDDWALLLGSNLGVTQGGDIYANSGHMAGLDLVREMDYDKALREYEIVYEGETSIDEDSEYYGGITQIIAPEYEEQPIMPGTPPIDETLEPGLYKHDTKEMILSWAEIMQNGYFALEEADAWYCDAVGNALVQGENFADFQWRSGDLVIDPDSGIVEIGDYAFSYCFGIKKIVVPEGVVGIGVEAMFECSNLVEVSLPTTLLRLDLGAFRLCRSLEKLIVPDSVTYIAPTVLSGCTNIRELVLPFIGDSVDTNTNLDTDKRIGYIFGDYPEQDEDGNLIISEPTDQRGVDYYIPNSFEKVTITGGYVQDWAFYNCKYLKEIHILSDCYNTFEDDGSCYIGQEAFYNCKSLEKLTVPFVGTTPTNEDGYEQNVFGYWFGYDSTLANNSVEAYSSNEDLTCWVDSEDFISFTECDETHITRFEATYDGEKWTMDRGGSTVSWSGEWMNGITIQGTPVRGDVVTFIYNADFFFVEQEYNDEGNYYQSHIPTRLKSIEIRGGNINAGAFSKCAMIENISLGRQITKIGNNAFKDCIALTTFEAAENNSVCDSIGERVFDGCTSLSIANLPKVINTVGEKIFYNCPSLTQISVPYCGSGSDATNGEETNLVYLFGQNGLNEDNGVANETLYPAGDANYISHPYMPKNLSTVRILQGEIKYCGLSRYSVFETIIIGRYVTQIHENAFEDCKARNIVVENYSDLQAIGDSAFVNCVNITELDFSRCYNLTTVGNLAFYNCDYLEVVHLPESVTSLGEECFRYCNYLREITIPFCGSGKGDTIFENSIAYNFSLYCLSSDSILYSTWYTNDGTNYAIRIPRSLKKITILGGDLYENAFYMYPQDTTIVLGKNVTSIGVKSFYGCGIKHVDASAATSISAVGESAFSKSHITEVKLPKSVTIINNDAFKGCASLSSLIIPADSQLDVIGIEAFMGCSGLYTFNIPDSTTRIRARAFKDCTGLVKMFIPTTVTNVEEYIFSGCSSLSVFVEYDYVPNTFNETWIDNDCGIRVTYSCDRYMYGRFNMSTKAKCYKTVPTFDADREIYYYDDSEEFYYGELINAYNNGHIYFIDSDKQAYCKLICNNGIYGFIRYKYVYGVVYHSKFKGSNFELSSMPTASDGIYTSLVCYDNDGDATVILNTDGLICNNASIEYLNSAEINGGKLLASNVILGNNLQINSKSVYVELADKSKVGFIFGKESSNEFEYVANLSYHPDKKMGKADEKLMINITDIWGNRIVLQEGKTFTVYYRRKGGDKRSISIHISAFSSYGECVIDKTWANFNIAWYSFDSNNHSVHTYNFKQGESSISNNIGVYGNLIPLESGYTLGDANHLWDTIYASSATINTSDKNKKNSIENIADIYGDLFDMLRPVTFKYNEGSSDRTHMGLIANELKEAIEAVGLTTQDVAAYCSWIDSEGNESCGIRYEELIPLNIFAIQKLKARVAELEQQIEKLTK